MKQRKQYTPKDKMKAIYAFTMGKTPNEALTYADADFEMNNSKDPKHALKLLHKWKQEVYANKKLNGIINRASNYIFFETNPTKKLESDFISKYYTNKLNSKIKKCINDTQY